MQVSRGNDDITTPVQLRVGWQHALSASRGQAGLVRLKRVWHNLHS